MTSTSSKRNTWVVDLDGVLANFHLAFLRLLERVSTRETYLPDTWEPATWEWPATLFSDAEIAEAWRQTTWEWWLDVPAYASTRQVLDELALREWGGDLIYFVTCRPHHADIRRATGHWLEVHGFHRPSVILTPPGEAKGLIARAVGASIIIDDERKHLIDARLWSPGDSPQLWLVDRPWNRSGDRFDQFALRHIPIENLPRVIAETNSREEVTP
jgi:hypothetical protein